MKHRVLYCGSKCWKHKEQQQLLSLTLIFHIRLSKRSSLTVYFFCISTTISTSQFRMQKREFFREQELHPSSESLTADLLVSKTEPHKRELFSSPTIFSGWVSYSSVPPALHFVHKPGNDYELWGGERQTNKSTFPSLLQLSISSSWTLSVIVNYLIICFWEATLFYSNWVTWSTGILMAVSGALLGLVLQHLPISS